jgi:hypothetical protein
MKNAMQKFGWVVALGVMALAPALQAQDDSEDRDYRDSDNLRQERRYDDDRYGEPMRIDRYLDVQVWPNRDDAEYYTGDNVVINFRANRDCFVAIYSIDSRGRVNLLFPNDPSDDNYITGGVTYKLPGNDDRYDLKIDGPSGREHLQIVASRERLEIPNWYRNSGLVCDADDRNEYMDYLNERHFVRYPGQRFALDRAVLFVKEWEPDYYRPIYNPYYPDWAVCGNVYIDYPWGGSVYINGIYWGVAPLYVPRLVVGWHVVTIYDPWGYCWESDFHINRYHTVIFDRTVVKTSRVVVSRYKEVNVTKWRDPVKHGYPDYKPVVATKTPRGTVAGVDRLTDKGTRMEPTSIDDFRPLSKKYSRGETGLVKTERGYEAAGDAKGIKTTTPLGFDKSRRSNDDNGGSRTYEKVRTTDESGSTYRRKSGSSGSVETTTRRSEGSGESERSRILQKQERKSEPSREPAKVEKKSEGESKGESSKPTVKEAPKSNPQPQRQSPPPSNQGKSKGGDNNSGGKGKKPN